MVGDRNLVLVVDDDQALLKLVARTLRMEGYDVVTVDNGMAALHLVESLEPDLIVLDIMMPGMTGWEVAERVRQRWDIPIVMLTAKSGVRDQVKGLGVGADDYVCKPFNSDQLLDRVEKTLRRVRLHTRGRKRAGVVTSPAAAELDARSATEPLP